MINFIKNYKIIEYKNTELISILTQNFECIKIRLIYLFA